MCNFCENQLNNFVLSVDDGCPNLSAMKDDSGCITNFAFSLEESLLDFDSPTMID